MTEAKTVTAPYQAVSVRVGPKRDLFEDEAMPHASSLLRAAISMVGDLAAAEDLVQDTLLRAWRFFDRFEPGTNCKAWLFRIMLNLSHEVRRSRAAASLTPLLETHASNPNEHDLLDQYAVRCAFDTLPSDQRIVIHLAIVEGFTCKEIAEMSGMPIGTVMSRLSRGRAAMRDQLIGQRGAKGSSSEL